MLRNILFVKYYPTENAPGSFHYKFLPSKLPLNHTTRSSSTSHVKNCPSENVSCSFNDKFHPSKLPLNDKTRSSSTCQLKVNNFKTERYGPKSIVNKCTLDWNKAPKDIKNKTSK